MSSNIIFKISKDTIIINEIKKEVDYKSLNNTNIIDIKELKFTVEYIKENFELVSNFLSVIIIKKNIKIAQINTVNASSVCLDLIKEWKQINTIIFKENIKITYGLFIKLLDNKNITKIDCYEMPYYLIERIDTNRKIKVTTRNKKQATTKFMLVNSLNSFSDIYYKKGIVISGNFEETDIDDITNFMNINNKLKKIRIVNYSNEVLTTIVELIKETKRENILIEINEKNNDLNTIYNTVTYIKKKYRKYFEDNNIRFKLSYSNEYKHNNFVKEINFKMFTSLILLVILLSTIVVGINYYHQYIDKNKILDTEIELNRLIDDAQELKNIDDNDSDIDYIDVGSNEEVPTTKKVYYGPPSAYYTRFDQVFETLKQKNQDTVGWITVNNTKINYPIVQTNNNTYYLNHDFNKYKNSMGWIFMDYRNDNTNLDRNTIIYGHNIKQGILFGTIKNMMNSNWYKKPENQIITFNTPTKNMKWKIFSLYQIKTTEDYLNIAWNTDEEYESFLNMLKSRSKADFGVELNKDSKILTLSTCFSHSTRHVVHAVLIEEIDTTPKENVEE